MYFLFVNKTYSQITNEPYSFKMQIFKVLFSEVREPTDKFLCLYDLKKNNFMAPFYGWSSAASRL